MSTRLHRKLQLGTALVALVFSGCPKKTPDTKPSKPPVVVAPETSAVGVFHELKQGETLYGLARRYGIHVDELVEVNGIADPTDLRPGRLIFIPDADPMAPAPDPKQTRVSSAQPSQPKPVAKKSRRLLWPVAKGVLYSGFGIRRGVRHDGIDLGAPEGTPVLAADSGEVIYVGYDKAFGNLVILRHSHKLITVYAHNRDVTVNIGQKITRGQTIAHLGKSGRSEGPHLHFEIREGTRPVDPLQYLPDE